MVCNGCGNVEAYRTRSVVGGGEVCDKCGGLRPMADADVYFRGPYLDPHLVDVRDPRQKDGVWVRSKAHKKELMQKLGFREAGDARHGCKIRDSVLKFQERRPVRG